MPGPEGSEFIIDAGPESFVTRKRAIWTLICELGLADKVIDPGGEAKGTYVLDGGKPIALPLSPGAFIGTSLLSARGKLRMLAEPFIARKMDDEDESLAAFVTRRLGREALDKFIGPVLGGIYNTNPDVQSILISSPVMREMERDYGGLFRGLVGRMWVNHRQRQVEANPPPSRFVGFARGAEVLVQALVSQLTADLKPNTNVSRIEGCNRGYRVICADGETLEFDAVILATPANISARLLRDIAPGATDHLAKIEHNHIGTISLAYHLSDLQKIGTIRGLMIPRREGRRIDAVVFTSAKISERAPAGYGLLRVFFGGGDPETAMMPEAALLEVVMTELRHLLGITAVPLDYRLSRWTNSYAQASVGHLDLVEQIEQLLPIGIFVTGASYRGLAVPDCIIQGRAVARQALNQSAQTYNKGILVV